MGIDAAWKRLVHDCRAGSDLRFKVAATILAYIDCSVTSPLTIEHPERTTQVPYRTRALDTMVREEGWRVRSDGAFGNNSVGG